MAHHSLLGGMAGPERSPGRLDASCGASKTALDPLQHDGSRALHHLAPRALSRPICRLHYHTTTLYTTLLYYYALLHQVLGPSITAVLCNAPPGMQLLSHHSIHSIHSTRCWGRAPRQCSARVW